MINKADAGPVRIQSGGRCDPCSGKIEKNIPIKSARLECIVVKAVAYLGFIVKGWGDLSCQTFLPRTVDGEGGRLSSLSFVENVMSRYDQ